VTVINALKTIPMKASNYNFQWLESQPLHSWMKKNRVETLHVEEIEGIRFAVSKCGWQILMASTVPGLCGDMQVALVTNKRHKMFPGEYAIITWAPYANRRKTCKKSYTCTRVKNYVERDYSLSA
jgi:hypothetical protein